MASVLPGMHLQVHAAQHVHVERAFLEALVQVLALQDRRKRRAAPSLRAPPRGGGRRIAAALGAHITHSARPPPG